MKTNRKGFTLIEMLIVIAIICILIAISLPALAAPLHKTEVAADWANIRSYYAQLQYDFMETGKINNSYLSEFPLSSFELSGSTVKLKAGVLYIRQEDPAGTLGYNFYYECNQYHDEHRLILPSD